ncbi:Vacuolar amino acid transporter 6 [Diplonema papillatum]|nr:Vacuolar amino acid transporter 6 [Diplonema papillatum]
MGQDRDRWSQTTSTLGSEQDDEWDKTTFHDRDDHLRSEASMLASMLNLLNNVVGAGLFSLSWCLYESTLVTGMCMMVFMGVLNALSFILLAQCCELAGTCSYLKMMQSAFGRTGGLAAQIIVLMYGCGSCISFVVLTGDFLCGSGTGVLDSWSSNEWLHKRWLIMSGVAVFVFFPLSCMRNLEPLKYTSSVSLLATMYAAAVCVWALALDNDDVFPPELKNQSEELRDSVDYIGFPVGVFAALPLVNVAFTCHYNAPRYYNELKDRTPRRWSIVVFVVMTFAMMIYAAAAVTGYLVFGNQIDGDILKNFSDKWSPAVVARLALACLVIFTFPMVCHFIRDSIIDLYWDGKYTTDSCPTKEFLLITAAIIVISTTVGVTVTKVEVVLAYKGMPSGNTDKFELDQSARPSSQRLPNTRRMPAHSQVHYGCW